MMQVAHEHMAPDVAKATIAQLRRAQLRVFEGFVCGTDPLAPQYRLSAEGLQVLQTVASVLHGHATAAARHAGMSDDTLGCHRTAARLAVLLNLAAQATPRLQAELDVFVHDLPAPDEDSLFSDVHAARRRSGGAGAPRLGRPNQVSRLLRRRGLGKVCHAAQAAHTGLTALHVMQLLRHRSDESAAEFALQTAAQELAAFPLQVRRRTGGHNHIVDAVRVQLQLLHTSRRKGTCGAGVV